MQRKRTPYWTCPWCGANNDYGSPCDSEECKDREAREREQEMRRLAAVMSGADSVIGGHCLAAPAGQRRESRQRSHGGL